MKKLMLLVALALATTSASAEIKRSAAAVRAFKKLHPCPATAPHKKGTCPGWIVDHIKALDCGGPDTPANMQWQTVAEAKAKDKWERKECGK